MCQPAGVLEVDHEHTCRVRAEAKARLLVGTLGYLDLCSAEPYALGRATISMKETVCFGVTVQVGVGRDLVIDGTAGPRDA